MRDLDVKTLVNILQRAMIREPKGNGRAGGLPVVWATTRGVMRDENQDRVLVAQAESGLVVAVLADGMGGMKEGARAAALAASALAAHCVAFSSAPIETLLFDALHFSNEEVFRTLRGSGGAAVVAAAWTKGARYVAHAGDARAYHIDEEGLSRQLTIDDTVRGQLQELGKPSAQDSSLHSQLLQFVGIGKALEPHVTRAPSGGRGLLLSSDGVHILPVQIMDWVLKRAGHLQSVAERLVTASEWNGGHDNGTIIAIGGLGGNEATSGSGATEFWLPGEHIALLSSKTNPAVQLPAVTEKRKSPSRKGHGRNQSNPKKESTTTSISASDRQSPIVDFGDSSPEDFSSVVPSPSLSSSNSNHGGTQPPPEATSNKQGNNQ